jgi:nucleoid-associated protein YgaU
MELKKAEIQPDGATAIPVLFNPGEYRLGKSNEIAAVETPGLAAPILQYVGGKSRTLSMELFFDTFEAGTDVRTHTGRIYGLLEIKKETHVPPLCTFRWGGFSFKGVIESVDGRFTLFFPNGTPARATLSVSFREAVNIGIAVKKTATESVDRRKTRIVKGGDTLSLIAAAEYGDPGQWRPIARANGITDPLALRPGQRLILPALT